MSETDRVDPRLVAHRGITFSIDGASAPVENTVEALVAAADFGCAAVEFDVHATADGVWVMHHDPTLERICAVDRAIADTDLATLRRETAKTRAPLATLAEALAALPVGCRPMVEVKPTTAAHFDALARDLADAARLDPIVIVRGDLPAAAAAAFPGVPIFLFEEDWDAAFARRDEPLAGYDLRHDPVDDAEIAAECARFAEAGKEIAVWTIDDPPRAWRWLDAGAPWVITNRVDRVMAARG